MGVGWEYGVSHHGRQSYRPTDCYESRWLSYASGIFWTVLYDMIYAPRGIQDDKKAGVMSVAVKHEQRAKLLLVELALCQVTMLVYVGYVLEAMPAYTVGNV